MSLDPKKCLGRWMTDINTGVIFRAVQYIERTIRNDDGSTTPYNTLRGPRMTDGAWYEAPNVVVFDNAEHIVLDALFRR